MSASRRVRAWTAGIRKQTSLGSLHAGCLGKHGFSELQLDLRARVGATCRLASPQAVDSAAEQRAPSSWTVSHLGLHWEVQAVWRTRERGAGRAREPPRGRGWRGPYLSRPDLPLGPTRRALPFAHSASHCP